LKSNVEASNDIHNSNPTKAHHNEYQPDRVQKGVQRISQSGIARMSMF
jgi:hypothetical protein